MKYPENYTITSGKGVSAFKLVAFDNALLDAGISNYNLLKVSSILPAGCVRREVVDVKTGSPLLTAYATISSDLPGDCIATAIAVGIPVNPEEVGVIMEATGIDAATTERIACEMVIEAMRNHGIALNHIESSSIEGTVEKDTLSLISAISFW